MLLTVIRCTMCDCNIIGFRIIVFLCCDINNFVCVCVCVYIFACFYNYFFTPVVIMCKNLHDPLIIKKR